MRFILNFFFFGFLFFLIYAFFPEAFATLVNWATIVYEFLRDLIQSAITAIKGHREAPVPEKEQVMALLRLFM